MTVPSVRLRVHGDHRVKAGHPWVFSNEIQDDVSTLPPGGTVDVFDAKGQFMGRGYANPRSLISIRLLSRSRKEDIDSPHFYAQKLRECLQYRQTIYPGRQSLRLVHAEGDGLPGLVIDRYGDVLSVQITTLGMESRKPALEQAIRDVFAPAGVAMRAEGKMRELEGLEDVRGVWWGDVPDAIDIDELGVKFVVNPLGSQKTGHFFDQAENRRFAGAMCAGKSVLDVYSNTGGFALHALKGGATSAICVDSSAENGPRALENAEKNGVALDFVVAEGRTTLEAMVADGKRFGAVMVDPPAFAKSRKVASKALVGYRDVNSLAMMLIEPGGLLFTSSCSYHVEEQRFLESMAEGASRAHRRLRIIRRGEQAPDHPVIPEVPESRYLKHFVFHVLLS